ncbi:acyl-coenzyme A thioesterase 13 isoform X2 [Carica papaya]|uniref:acyl-coenzyme A thioesterase 13 isoform X2 n=1 Tax=Carica papaya TaxID=3649 RepID=UPI000B8CA99B|nr:acyl-coenzyme A thioesterase 13 isoform X2 [Carica papaya]
MKMAKTPSVPPQEQISSSFSSISTTTMTKTIIKDMNSEHIISLLGFLEDVGVSDSTVRNYVSKDLYSPLLCSNLQTLDVRPGYISCLLSVKPAISNFYGGLHGGAAAAVAEKVSIACARTVVPEDKELFLGELSMSYLSAAPTNAKLVVDGSVVRSGRNITVVAINFKLTNSGKLVHTARATFYNSPVSKL